MPATKVKRLRVQSRPPAYHPRYDNWYDFKKDLESVCGRPVLNLLWLQVKPQSALPWNKSNLQESLSKIRKVKRQRNSNN